MLAAVIARGALRDPALQGVSNTVTQVRVSPDLRNATAFVMPLGGGETKPVMEGLARSAPWLGGQVARRVAQRGDKRALAETVRRNAQDALRRIAAIESRLDKGLRGQ